MLSGNGNVKKKVPITNAGNAISVLTKDAFRITSDTMNKLKAKTKYCFMP